MKTGNVILAVVIWIVGTIVGVFFGVPSVVMDESAGCVLSMIILVIAFIIGLLVILKGRETPIQQTQPSSKRHCPKCGREIPFDAVVCPYCQYDFK